MNSNGFFRPKQWVNLSLALLILVGGSISSVVAQDEAPALRPRTEELLPETTVLFIEVRDIKDFVSKLNDSNLGKLLVEDSIAPLAENLYGQANDAFNELMSENGVDLTMAEIQSLPAGEINMAIIAPKRKNPVFLFTFEFDQENETVGKILDVAKEAAESDGAEIASEEIEEVELIRLRGNAPDENVTYFQKDGILVASNSEDELTAYLDRWMGREVEKIRPLSKNRKFIRIMNRCAGTRDVPADLRVFVDPIELARSSFRGNVWAQASLDFLPVLGLDGLLGLGASATMFEDDFESVTHAHLLLSSPKKGLFEMIALKPANYRPKNWVPEDVTLFMSTSWDIKKTTAEIAKMVNTLHGEDHYEQDIIDNVNSEMGENFYEDILDSITGKISFVQWAPPESMALNAEAFVLGFELKGNNEWESIKERIRSKEDVTMLSIGKEAEKVFEESVHRGVPYWYMKGSWIDNPCGDWLHRMSSDRNIRRFIRREREGILFEWRTDREFLAVVENELLISNREEIIKVAIETSIGERKSLGENELYKKVVRENKRLSGADMPVITTYRHPARAVEHRYGLVRSESTQNLLKLLGEEYKYARNVKQALNDHPLPPFEAIEKYFQPGGAIVVGDDSGYHLVSFQFRVKDEEADVSDR